MYKIAICSMGLVLTLLSCNGVVDNPDLVNGIDTTHIYEAPKTRTISFKLNDSGRYNNIQPLIKSLKKYSLGVLVSDSNNNPAETGTGFLLRYKNKLFFITNRHVAYRSHGDVLRIFLDSGTYKIPIALRDLNDTFVFGSPQIDLAAFEIDEATVPSKAITDFKNEGKTKYKLKEYIVWGYPSTTSKKEESLITLKQGNFIDDDSIQRRYFETQNIVASGINVISSLKNAEDFLVPFELAEGFSGSPVFGLYDEKGQSIVQLIGIVKQGNADLKLSRGIMLKFIIDFLDHGHYEHVEKYQYEKYNS